MPTSHHKTSQGAQGAHATHDGESASVAPQRRARAQHDDSQRPKAKQAPARGRRQDTGSLSATNPGRVPTKGRARKEPANREARSAAVKREGPSFLMIIGIAAIVILLAGGIFVAVRIFGNPYEGARVEDGQTVTVVIPEGSSGEDIRVVLLDAGVIHSSKDFRQAVQAQDAGQSLHSGTYTFLTGSDPAEVVRQLVSGPNSSEGQLKVPEGLTIMQVADIVEQSLGISHDDFLAQAKASNYVDDYPFLSEAAQDSLEGYLYPKTYDFAGKEVSADAIIRQMLSQYQKETEALDMDAARDLLFERYGMVVTDYDLVKIASIIEKEVGDDPDGYKVASVFYNRLSANAALQSDATMMYVTGGVVTPEDLQTDSPYNTYLYKGLTPTPVCSPSVAALQEAMEPADTNDWYFYLDGDYHVFSETLEDHTSSYGGTSTTDDTDTASTDTETV